MSESERTVRRIMASYGIGPGSYQRPDDLNMLERWRAHRTGLAPHYPLLYSLAIGMGAQRVFEFGMGESTEVLLHALQQTGGRLLSCSPDTHITDVYQPVAPWTPLIMTSDLALKTLGPEDLFDLVLHDSSHSADVVAADLRGILPRVRQWGLVLVHDTLHSYVGAQMRDGLARGCEAVAGVTHVTLPFAFGLTVLQVTQNAALGPVSLGPEKAASPYHTLRMTEIADRFPPSPAAP